MKKIIKLINLFLLVIAITLSNLIFYKKNFNLNFIYKLYQNMISFVNIGKNVEDVSGSMKFIRLNEYHYYNDEYCVYSLKKGTVVEKNESSILVKSYDNEYQYFANLINITVNKYDVIDSEYPISNFIDYYVFYLIIDGECISYEKYIENH